MCYESYAPFSVPLMRKNCVVGVRKANLEGLETCNGIAEPPRRSSAFATLQRDEAGFPGGDVRPLGTHGLTPVANFW